MDILKDKKLQIIAGIIILLIIFTVLFFTRTHLDIDNDQPLKVITTIDGTIDDYNIPSDSESFKQIKDVIQEDFYLPSGKTISSPDLDSITLYFKSEGVQNEIKIISDGIAYLNQERIQFKFSTNDEEMYKSLKEIIEKIDPIKD